ncbi:hypothetical protein V9T40_009862 [Parthenolecanium corni]|uniref:Uncharacterized protein n=1 Tax=Parthenolecanium corni TaxID=536013 RepID=A0AAN9Y6U4_9HEMI
MKTGPKCGGVVWSGVAEFRGAEDAQPAADDTRMKYRRSMGRIGGNKTATIPAPALAPAPAPAPALAPAPAPAAILSLYLSLSATFVIVLPDKIPRILDLVDASRRVASRQLKVEPDRRNRNRIVSLVRHVIRFLLTSPTYEEIKKDDERRLPREPCLYNAS